eukprot:Pgem_evm1s5147
MYEGQPPAEEIEVSKETQELEDEKRVKRLEKNRVAARTCRIKKKEYVKCLEDRV